MCFFAVLIAAWCRGRWGSLPGTEKEEVSLRGLSEAESGSCKRQGWIVPWEDRHSGQWARGVGGEGEEEQERLMLNISFIPGFVVGRPVE